MEEGLSSSIEKEDGYVTPLTELLELFVDTAEKECIPGERISLKELNPSGGLYAETGEGFGDSMFYDKSMVRTFRFWFYAGIKTKRRD